MEVKKYLITALIMMITGMSVQAQTVSSTEIKSQIASQLEAIYNKNTNAEVEVKITATPFFFCSFKRL